jgi:S1-C subfamily serine protease
MSSTRSVVRFDVSHAGPREYGCGVVVAADGLVATNASLLAGAGRIMATTASGRRIPASVVAVDPTSDVGLVRVGANLPVAHFVDWSDVQPGTGAIELAVATRPSGGSQSMWQDETIASIGEPVGSGPGSGMVSVVASTPNGPNPYGAVLMERDGAVVGLLDRLGVSTGGGAVFLPGEFVSDVARDLMSHGGQIRHGWLGIEGSDSGTPDGALITSVTAGGPSTGLLSPGDVITAIDGRRVRSMADLRSRLYLVAPGSVIQLAVRRGGIDQTVGLVLGSTP